jgi:hypothetical protein
VTDRGYIGKDLEGSGCDLFEVLLWHFPGGTVENYGKRKVRITKDRATILTRQIPNKSTA